MRRRFRVLLLLVVVFDTAARPQAPPARFPMRHSSSAVPLLRVASRVVHLGFEGDEAMIVEAPRGTLAIAAQGGPWSSDSDYAANPAYWDAQWRARLWTSRDHGATWKQAVLGPDGGNIGNSDVDLAVAPDGTLYLALLIRPLEGGVLSPGLFRSFGGGGMLSSAAPRLQRRCTARRSRILASSLSQFLQRRKVDGDRPCCAQ
jgi:hypothetical protein